MIAEVPHAVYKYMCPNMTVPLCLVIFVSFHGLINNQIVKSGVGGLQQWGGRVGGLRVYF